jgi:hypothetical protein
VWFWCGVVKWVGGLCGCFGVFVVVVFVFGLFLFVYLVCCIGGIGEEEQ